MTTSDQPDPLLATREAIHLCPIRIFAGNDGPDLGNTWCEEPEEGWAPYVREDLANADTVALWDTIEKLLALLDSKAAELSRMRAGLRELDALIGDHGLPAEGPTRTLLKSLLESAP